MAEIRTITQNDIQELKNVIHSTELFPSELLDEMVQSFLDGQNTQEVWITKEIDNKPVAVAFYAPEKVTDRTYNVYLIAIHKDFQGRGIGSELMTYIEETLQRQGGRILIVETSSLPNFEQTRKFYDKLQYQREAIIRDFYQEGEHKIVFWKKLNSH
ncbi:acetyltransferase [bacterium 336/3]|nr:acetyltransferase [bacterium 336/3]